jgi:ABC-2 type transport system permease protein
MTTIVAPVAPPMRHSGDRPTIGHGRIFVDSLRFEWTKLRTVRSTWWTLLAAFAAMVGIATLVSELTVHQWATTTPAKRLLFDPLETSVSGAFFAQFAMGVLGVLVITTEYGTGMIRNTFAAVPQRWPSGSPPASWPSSPPKRSSAPTRNQTSASPSPIPVRCRLCSARVSTLP